MFATLAKQLRDECLFTTSRNAIGEGIDREGTLAHIRDIKAEACEHDVCVAVRFLWHPIPIERGRVSLWESIAPEVIIFLPVAEPLYLTRCISPYCEPHGVAIEGMIWLNIIGLGISTWASLSWVSRLGEGAVGCFFVAELL